MQVAARRQAHAKERPLHIHHDWADALLFLRTHHLFYGAFEVIPELHNLVVLAAEERHHGGGFGGSHFDAHAFCVSKQAGLDDLRVFADFAAAGQTETRAQDARLGLLSHPLLDFLVRNAEHARGEHLVDFEVLLKNLDHLFAVREPRNRDRLDRRQIARHETLAGRCLDRGADARCNSAHRRRHEQAHPLHVFVHDRLAQKKELPLLFHLSEGAGQILHLHRAACPACSAACACELHRVAEHSVDFDVEHLLQLGDGRTRGLGVQGQHLVRLVGHVPIPILSGLADRGRFEVGKRIAALTQPR